MLGSTLQIHSITESLGIQGWHHLDAVLLAALTTEAPLLLIGTHGTAKTQLVEKLANTLRQEFRHYNASLLNYDDLVGIPIPEDGAERLRFITTPGAIWDAEFVFFDEISRCRPDLQNKLFPIIHERRVLGMKLEQLQYRWAAMNPPSPDNPDIEVAINNLYLGSEPLDPALTDRFPFIVPVPDWTDLSRDDKRQILALRKDESAILPDETMSLSLLSLIQSCAALIPEIEAEAGDWIMDYLMCVMDLLEKAKYPQSPRRARMLAQSIVAVHAARLTLEGDDADLDMSAEIALMHGIPHSATEVPPAPATLVAIHKQAWEITGKLDDPMWRVILEEPDHLQRVVMALEMDFSPEDMTHLVMQVLNLDASEARKVGLGTALFLAFQHTNKLTPAAWEPLASMAMRVMIPRYGTLKVMQNAPNLTLWNEIEAWVISRRGQGGTADLEIKYVLSGFPHLWQQYNWKESLEQFKADLAIFSIKGELI